MNRFQLIAILAALTLTTNAQASTIEENIFNTIVDQGAYVHFRFTSPSEVNGAGSFYLESLSCTHSKLTNTASCEFTDSARPLDRTRFADATALSLLESLKASGIKEVNLPFSHGTETLVSAAKLTCDKSGFRPETVKFKCQRLKPLID